MSDIDLPETKIVVLNDEPLLDPAQLATWLTHQDNDVARYENADAILDSIATTHPQLLILNCTHLPETLIQTWQHHHSATTIIALLPADDHLVTQALNIGITQCLTMPVVESLFQHVLARTLQSVYPPHVPEKPIPYYELVVEQAHTVVMIVDDAGKLAFINQYGVYALQRENLTDTPPSLGKTLFEILPPRLAEVFQEKSQQAIAEHKNYTYEYLAADGQTWLMTLFYPLMIDEHTTLAAIVAYDITVYKHAQLELIEHQSFYELMYKRAAIGILHATPDRQIVQVNDTFAHMLGYTPAELAGINADEITHPDDLVVNETLLEKVLSSPSPRQTGQKRYLHKNGQTVWCELVTSRLEMPNSDRVAIILFVKDITEQKAYEIALAQKNQEQSTLLEIAHAVGSTRDLEEVLNLLLDHLIELVPYTSASIALVTDTHVDYIAGRGLPDEINLSELSEALTNDQKWKQYHREDVVIVEDVMQDPHWVEIPDQEIFMRSWMGVPIIYQDQLLGQLNLDHIEVGFFTQEHARQAFAVASQVAVAIENAQLFAELEARVALRTIELNAQKEQTEVILNNIRDAVIMMDASGNILYANPAWMRINDLNLHDILGRNMREFSGYYELDVLKHEGMWREIEQGNNWRGQLQYQTPNGHTIDVDMSVVAVQRKEGTVYISVLRDISEQRKLDRMKAQFIADAAHDLGNPLAILTLKLYLLKEQPEQLMKHLPTIDRQVIRLNALVEDLLVVSRLDRKVLPFSPEATQVNDLVLNILQNQQLLAEEKQIDIHFDPLPTLPKILADEKQIQRVIVNLVFNAINYTPQGGQITIQTAHIEDDQVCLSIKDTGIGIPEDELNRVFDRFFRGVHASGTADGTGLGLSIVQEIMGLHGGRVEVDSTLGEGSEFRLYFNIAPPEK